MMCFRKILTLFIMSLFMVSFSIFNFVKEAKRRRSDIVFGGDFIAGFPTEDEKAHQNIYEIF